MNIDIGECAIYKYHSKKENTDKYYYGGGCYCRLNETDSELILANDYLRGQHTGIHSDKIKQITADHDKITAVLNNGDTITGSGTKRVLPDDESIKLGMCYDVPELLTQIAENSFIVNFHLLRDYHYAPLWKTMHHIDIFICDDKELYRHKNPITYTYIKEGDRVYIDYYDLVEKKLLNKRHSAPCYFRNVPQLVTNEYWKAERS